MKLIKEAKDQLAVIKYASGNYRGYIERECRLRWNTHANWEVVFSAPALYAWIDKANWVVRCDVCNEQIVINRNEDYFCPNCLNMTYSGKARRVVFPPSKEADEIERLLSLRPNPVNRNWLPHETAKDIEDENIKYGITEKIKG